MLNNSERYPLQNMLLEDLLLANKLPIVLILLLISTALGTIWITHYTRMLITEKNELVLQHQALENEFLNLKLEEATQSDNTRVEAIASGKFKMQRVEPEQEVVILE